MSLIVQELELTNFRNFSQKSVVLDEGMTLLVGPNAVGKTNSIEALQLLTRGNSFRHPRPEELILEGQKEAKIALSAKGDGRILDVSCTIKPSKRHFTRNGKACRPKSLLGELPSVLFCPDDLNFIKGSGRYRRAEVDGFASQASKGYNSALAAYTKSVDQRNRLLKEDYIDELLLSAWDESVSYGAATLLLARKRLLNRLIPLVCDTYKKISDGEKLSLSYKSSAGEFSADADREELAEQIAHLLYVRRSEERRRQQTLIGPHRDDITFYISGRDARDFGSQGQQRTIVLAWKMAEVQLSNELLGQQPLLLLDDVMSELDARRREEISRFIEKGIQAVVTTTNLGYFSDEVLSGAKVVEYG